MWNEQDTGKIPEVIAESYTEYKPVVSGGTIQGTEAFEEWFQGITAAFPDFQAADGVAHRPGPTQGQSGSSKTTDRSTVSSPRQIESFQIPGVRNSTP